MNIISGPKTPPGFSGVKPWVLRAIVVIVLGLAALIAFVMVNQKALTPASADPALGRHVHSADAQSLTVTAREAVPPVPTPAPVQQVALADLGQQPGAQQQVPSAATVTAPTAPPTLSPAQIAAAERHAAVAAPWGSTASRVRDAIATPAQRVAATFQKDGSAYDVAPPSQYFLEPGHDIYVTLASSIDSTVPGMITGEVSYDVQCFGTKVICIPAHAKVTGHLGSSNVQPGQARIAALADWVILPNGHGIPMEGAPFIDQDGTTGLGARIDNHDRRRITSIVAGAVAAAGAQLSQPQGGNGCGTTGCTPSVGQAIGSAVGGQIASATAAEYQRNAQIQPTAHVVEGAQVAIQVQTYIPLNEWVQQP